MLFKLYDKIVNLSLSVKIFIGLTPAGVTSDSFQNLLIVNFKSGLRNFYFWQPNLRGWGIYCQHSCQRSVQNWLLGQLNFLWETIEQAQSWLTGWHTPLPPCFLNFPGLDQKCLFILQKQKNYKKYVFPAHNHFSCKQERRETASFFIEKNLCKKLLLDEADCFNWYDTLSKTKELTNVLRLLFSVAKYKNWVWQNS